MTTHHTPGPWEYDGFRIISKATNDEIFHLCTDATYDANNRLMAAAPELLGVLTEALEQSNCDGDLCAYSWHEKARQLIARVEGK